MRVDVKKQGNPCMNGKIFNGALILAVAIFLTVLALHVRTGTTDSGQKGKPPGGCCGVCGAKQTIGSRETAGGER